MFWSSIVSSVDSWKQTLLFEVAVSKFMIADLYIQFVYHRKRAYRHFSLYMSCFH